MTRQPQRGARKHKKAQEDSKIFVHYVLFCGETIACNRARTPELEFPRVNADL